MDRISRLTCVLVPSLSYDRDTTSLPSGVHVHLAS